MSARVGSGLRDLRRRLAVRRRAAEVGVGLGLEWLRPPRQNLDARSGRAGPPHGLARECARLAPRPRHRLSLLLRRGPLDGLATFDLGLAGRVGNHLAFGGNLRDSRPRHRRRAGPAPLRARSARSSARHRPDRGRGGWPDRRDRGDVDGWARVAVRALRGAFVSAPSRAARSTRSMNPVDRLDRRRAPRAARDRRARAVVRRFGLAAYGTGVRAPQVA